MQIVYLGLGTNSGERLLNLKRACEELKIADRVDVFRKSSVFHTEPWGYTEQAYFLNAVLEIRTTLDSRELLSVVKQIEKRIGRKKSFRWGPRVIDIDIISFGNERIGTKGLVIPHPEMHLRKFVLVPLAEIAPFFIHPVHNESIWRLLVQSPENEVLWHSTFPD
ncbi:MAG: 2-amino-4-hydroxy-6-hydroxymethyldihydropteridine diphosphokinase [candidate division KSB1 bacterium]|jgi:2-amino-4-hydroxy-6-hydroxymethyldihydropteridine diphosphokinase|nr:2-amino-4-hydroxy-6-hydroxymethyldihydropteridine diphosphokinase [candidate division KSB1 bacterium]